MLQNNIGGVIIGIYQVMKTKNGWGVWRYDSKNNKWVCESGNLDTKDEAKMELVVIEEDINRKLLDYLQEPKKAKSIIESQNNATHDRKNKIGVELPAGLVSMYDGKEPPEKTEEMI